jgi:SOS-response transcriptional repressor LexA
VVNRQCIGLKKSYHSISLNASNAIIRKEAAMTSRPLTNRQAETLELIKGFINQKGYAPSVTEVSDLLKLKSRSTAHSLVKQLVDKGYLEKTDYEVRTLRVVGQKTSDSLQSQKDLREQNWRLLLENVELRKKLKQLEKY